MLYQFGEVDRAYHFVGLSARGEASAPGPLSLQGARCLAVLERDMDQVQARLDEVSPDALPNDAQLDYLWTRGLLHRFAGDEARAAVDLERALGHATRDEQHWEKAMLLLALAIVHLESRHPTAALDCARRLKPIAARLGESVEGPAASVVEALATGAEAHSWTALDAALEAVRQVDGKAMLATFSNFAAELALARSEPQRAEALARSALEAAAAVSLRSQQVLARAMLAKVALARGNAGEALEALRRECEQAASARSLKAAQLLLQSHPKKG
jgi:hypothetical protein